MPLDVTPTTWFVEGYSVNAADHLMQFYTADAPSGGPQFASFVTDAQADPTTGDARQIIFALMEAFYSRWLSNANLDPANNPARMSLSSQSDEQSDGTLRRTFIFRFDLNRYGSIVLAEPTP